MFRFLTSPPLPLRTLHLLQTALAIPSLPILVICIFGLLVLGPSPVLLVQFPWILSSGSNFVLLSKERRTAAQGELDARRYARLQAFEVAWTGVFFAPVVAAWVFAERMRLFVWVVVNIKCWVEWEWAMMAWFNALHWFFIIVSLLYGAIFFNGQTESTIRLRTDEPIGLDTDGSTANDEAIARELQANEPEWEA